MRTWRQVQVDDCLSHSVMSALSKKWAEDCQQPYRDCSRGFSSQRLSEGIITKNWFLYSCSTHYRLKNETWKRYWITNCLGFLIDEISMGQVWEKWDMLFLAHISLLIQSPNYTLIHRIIRVSVHWCSSFLYLWWLLFESIFNLLIKSRNDTLTYKKLDRSPL